MKVNIHQSGDGYWMQVHDGTLEKASGINFITRTEARQYAAVRGWQVVPKHRQRAKLDPKHEVLAKILIAHEKESGSNIRELYSLAEKIMAEIDTWKKEKPNG